MILYMSFQSPRFLGQTQFDWTILNSPRSPQKDTEDQSIFGYGLGTITGFHQKPSPFPWQLDNIPTQNHKVMSPIHTSMVDNSIVPPPQETKPIGQDTSVDLSKVDMALLESMFTQVQSMVTQSWNQQSCVTPRTPIKKKLSKKASKIPQHLMSFNNLLPLYRRTSGQHPLRVYHRPPTDHATLIQYIETAQLVENNDTRRIENQINVAIETLYMCDKNKTWKHNTGTFCYTCGYSAPGIAILLITCIKNNIPKC